MTEILRYALNDNKTTSFVIQKEERLKNLYIILGSEIPYQVRNDVDLFCSYRQPELVSGSH
ncbi:hypothetical protein [uncultured Psychroserpens sp.]|uniref:hypothetical protein n=1 Tax=uncultured Psychroserpens sp. TaxID=255436 RepID=UPI00262D76CE|nr:hypothetical protein [uncultured Psychroserpens sp.]